MNPFRRALEGLTVNLSISQSDNIERFGFSPPQVNRITLQIATALVGQGASLVFGHDWRRDGVMESVYGFARQVQIHAPLSPERPTAEQQPLVANLLPWPESPCLPECDIEKLSPTLKVERVGLPAELLPFGEGSGSLDPNKELYRYLRARGLTFLRHRLNDESRARICVGGRCSHYEGRYPGVVEEAFLAIQARKPLYLAGFLGGAAEQVIGAFEGREMTDEFCLPTGIKQLYDTPPVEEASPTTVADRVINRQLVWETFIASAISGPWEYNGLSPADNDELMHTSVVERAIELILIGLSRIRPRAVD